MTSLVFLNWELKKIHTSKKKRFLVAAKITRVWVIWKMLNPRCAVIEKYDRKKYMYLKHCIFLYTVVRPGAFKADMTPQRPNSRTIKCRYDPQEPGDYAIVIKWSNKHVPGSPFRVRIHDADIVVVEQHPRSRGISTSMQQQQQRYGGPNTTAINGADVYDDDDYDWFDTRNCWITMGM